jgi:hypothetical protein
MTRVRKLLSLDRDGGSRNVRQIEIGVGIAKLGRQESQARSSVEEHYLDTVGVGGSIPPVPTNLDGNPERVPKPSRLDGNPERVPKPSDNRRGTAVRALAAMLYA